MTTRLRPTTPNVLRVFDSATDAQLSEGLTWYADAFQLACELDPADPGRAAGVIAAFSPRVTWTQNVRYAVRAYLLGYADIGLRASVTKVNRILSGERPLDVLGGPKTRAFWQLISDPSNSSSVCVDMHAFDIAVGRRTDDRTRGQLALVGEYDRFARTYRRAAAELSILPWQAQAVTWVAWRAAS